MNCKMRKIVIFRPILGYENAKNGGFLRFFVVKRPGWGEKWGVFWGVVTRFTCVMRVFLCVLPCSLIVDKII